MFDLCTDYVNPRLKSIYFAIRNQLKVGNYQYLSETTGHSRRHKGPITDEQKLMKKSVESLIALWHEAHDNDRYKEYYQAILVPPYFIFPSDYNSVVSLLKDIDFTELLVLISPITVRDSLKAHERKKFDDIMSGDSYLGHNRAN